MPIQIDLASLSHLLGIPASTPLTTGDMCRKLQLVFYPADRMSPRMNCFVSSLKNACRTLGIQILKDEEARQDDGKFKPGVVVIAPGTHPDDKLAINQVSTLYNNIIVGIHDEATPLDRQSPAQQKLDMIVSRLAWDMVHISIYLDSDSWTICTMNGGVVRLESSCPLPSDILKTLVPKLTAQVVPPKPSDLDYRPGSIPAGAETINGVAQDFSQCAALWRSNDLLLTHTSRQDLTYRSALYRKIVARYLDERSGMSYGFFARQLPSDPPAAIRFQETDLAAETIENTPSDGLTYQGKNVVPVRVIDEWFLVEPGPVTVITTRSGCKKTALDPATDLVSITLDNGRITLRTPANLPDTTVSRPSFDTLTILAHALGNRFIASILKTIRPSWEFPLQLAASGASMTHWHGYPEQSFTPEGYFIHGQKNPPVSCSTPQSAVYSFLGKIDALEKSLETGIPYRGDIHIEPNHGTNIVGTLTLAETAALVNAPCQHE